MQRTVSTGGKYTFIGNYRYEQDHLLGSGFQSQVYKAQHRLRKHQVALKVVDVEKLGEGINQKLFESELRCLEQLKSTPHVLNLHEVIRTEEKIYVVTELCFGDLSNRSDKKLPKEEAWAYLQQAIKGYRYLYEKRIVHRDLKPGNLFFNMKKEIKIGDFGFAGKLHDVKKQNYYNIGSPGYMAPETVSRNEYSFATDIWAIGIIYYELLTGKLPWTGTTEEKINKQMTEAYLRCALIHPQIDQDSKKFLQRVLCFNEFDRMNAEQLFSYQLGQDNAIEKDSIQLSVNKRKIFNFDELSTTTAENTEKFQELRKKTPKKMNNFFNQFSPPQRESSKKINLKTLIQLNSTRNQTLKDLKNQKPTNNRRNSFNVKGETNFLFPSHTPKASHIPLQYDDFKKKRKSFDVSYNFQKKRPNNIQQSQKLKLEGFIAAQIRLIQKILSFFKNLSQIQLDQRWESQVNLMQVCLRTVMVNIVTNNQKGEEYFHTIVGHLETKRYLKSEDYEKHKNIFAKFQKDFNNDPDLQKYWKKSRVQNIDGAINEVLAFLLVLRPSLTDSRKYGLQVAFAGCEIAKILWKMSHPESFYQNEEEDNIFKSGKVLLRRSEAFQRIEQALLLKPTI